MPIRDHLSDQTTFEPEAITAMSTAFEQACDALHVFSGDARGREAVATRIIDLARNGVIDATALRDRVLQDSQASA